MSNNFFFYSGNFNTTFVRLSANDLLVSRLDAVPHRTGYPGGPGGGGAGGTGRTGGAGGAG